MIADLAMPVPHVLTPADVLREVKHLPSAPRVLPRLKDLLGDGNSALQDIVGLIRLDPSMAARVLQVSNSAYFSKGGRCLTVEEAVNRVGYDQVYELVSFAAASQVLVRPLEVYGIAPDDLWKMSVACAMAADLLAERTGQDRSIAYTIGLLHSIGMVAINEWALRCRRGLKLPLASFPLEAVEAERAALGFTQAEMGGTLLHAWQFAAPIVEPVRLQYSPHATVAHSRMANLLYLAKWVRSSVCGTNLPAPASLHFEGLGFGLTVLGTVADEVTARLAMVDVQLQKTGGPVSARQRFPGQSWQG